MRKAGGWKLGTGAAAAAVAVASAVAVTGGSAQAPAARTLTLVECDAGFVTIDVPPRSGRDELPGRGDSFMFQDVVSDAAGARLGRIVGRCTLLRVVPGFDGSTFLCDAVYALPDGTITASALVTASRRQTVTFAVDGGTGAYEGARGSGTSVDRPRGGLTDTTIRLLP